MNNTIDFAVRKQQLTFDDGGEAFDIPKRHVVLREDTLEPLGIVSSNYQLVPHRSVINAFSQIPNLKQDRISLCKNGAIMFADYTIQEKNETLLAEVKKGDTVGYQVRAFNSYNMECGVGFEIRALRLVCTNGLTIPKGLCRLSFKHVEGLNMSKLTEIIFQKMEGAREITQIWRKWTDTKVSSSKIAEFCNSLDTLGEKTRERLCQKSLNEHERDGLWGVFNVFTAYTTHETKSRLPENKVLAQRSKEQEVLSKFYNFDWNLNI
jgi:hypothetical protein